MARTRKSTSPSLKKRYGQHHLRSGDLCRPLVDFLRPKGERVVEIGPGGGVLTAELAAAGARVWALEVDVEWACALQERRLPGVSVAASDALRFDWSRLPPGALVTGNLPFNVGTRLIERILAVAALAPERLPRLGFMVQKEVGDRLVAAPGDPAYGGLSVLVRAQASVRRLGLVAPGSFRPPPKVAAAFVGLSPRAPAYLSSPGGPGANSASASERAEAFRKLVHLAFGLRRKTLRNSLARGWGKARAEEAIAAAGLDPRARAETRDVAEMVALLGASEALAGGPAEA
ncbi:MAG: 16S rRNA (adenine(1518)-N(6)/adenine(1519)-N(6))-dimethyltransferase RsmA [Acidobacteriota bacterium]